MAGYTRTDTTNNIATGNVINASDLDNEYDAIQAAYNATTGHTHGGAAGEGAPITRVGPVQDVVVSGSAVTPKTDNTMDLGSSTLEFKDLYIDGTANIDSLVADTADINGGTVDGAVIGGSTPAAGTFTTATATTGNITTVNATTVNTTNLDLTNLEVTNIKAKDGTASATIADSTGVITVASSVLTTTDINGGTIDGAVIGGASAAAGNFTTLGATGVATFSAGTVSAPAITTTGDTNTGIFFPAADTIAFAEGGVESMRINASGQIGLGTNNPQQILEAVTSGVAYLRARSSASTFTGVDFGQATSGEGRVIVRDAQPLSFYTNATEKMRITSGGDVGIGTSSPSYKLQVAITGAATSTVQDIGYLTAQSSGTTTSGFGSRLLLGTQNANGNVWPAGIAALNSSAGSNLSELGFYTATSGPTLTERMRIDSSGNVGIGVSSVTTKLDILGTQVANRGVLQVIDNTAQAAGTGAGITLGGVFNAGGSTSPAVQIKAAKTNATSGDYSFDMAFLNYANGAANMAETMRITSAGNVGIGLAPNAWSTARRAIEVGGSIVSSLGLNSSVSETLHNSYWTASALKYAVNGPAGFLSFNNQAVGGWVWSTAASGTAGADVTYAERMRLTNAGVLELPVGQIKFPATQSASSDANTLDDYEEGTWTPAIGGTSVTYGTREATYVKVGRQVLIQGRITLTGGSPNNVISNLPFSAANTDTSSNGMNINTYLGSAGVTFPAGTTYMTSFVLRNGTSIFLEASGSGAASNTVTVANTATIYFAGSYITAS